MRNDVAIANDVASLIFIADNALREAMCQLADGDKRTDIQLQKKGKKSTNQASLDG